MYRTTYGFSLDILTTRLSGFAADDELQGADWAMAITEAFLWTPRIWPLGDELFEMLLSWAGMDLDTPGGTEFAVAVSRYLEGTGICPVVCTHPVDDPSPRCARVRSGELPELYERGLLYEGTHDREHWIAVRIGIARAFDRSHQTADTDADEGDADEEYPDAA